MNSLKSLKYLLGVVAVYHIGIGLVGLVGSLFPSFATQIAHLAFNFNITVTPEILWIMQPFSAYVIIFGVMAAVAMRDPLKYSALVYVSLLLIGFRIIQRINFLIQGGDFVVDVTTSVIGIAVVVVIGIGLIILLRKAKQS